MPPASGRYQSRLFNFIHRQSQRLSDRMGETLRHVKVSAGWSLQTLLFTILAPIQKALQNVGKQIAGEPSQTNSRQLHGNSDEIVPDVDIPIANVLGNARTFPSYKHHARATGMVTQTTAASIQYVPHLRGIACQLTDRALVLVNSVNEILNILTPQEQQKLLDKIISETTEYQAARREFEARIQQHQCTLAEIDQILGKLTGNSVNTKDQNIATIAEKPAENSPKIPLPPHSLELIDAALAKFEDTAIVPVAETTTSLIHKIAEKIQIFVYGNHQNVDTNTTNTNLATWENQNNQNITVNQQIQTDTNPIKQIILAAIHYFFGRTGNSQINHQGDINHHLHSNPSPQKRFNHRNQRVLAADETIEDPWLTVHELFGEVIPVETTRIVESLEQSAPTPQINEQPTADKLLQSQQSTAIVKSANSTPSVSQIPTTRKILSSRRPQRKKSLTPISLFGTSKIQDTHRASNEFSKQLDNMNISGNDDEFDLFTDWIEINASTVSYEKHPLEQLLEWLDKLMAWLEAKLVKGIKFIWNWWKSRR